MSYTYSTKFLNSTADIEYSSPYPGSGAGAVTLANGNTAVLTVAAGSITDIGPVSLIKATGTTATGIVPLFTQRA